MIIIYEKIGLNVDWNVARRVRYKVGSVTRRRRRRGRIHTTAAAAPSDFYTILRELLCTLLFYCSIVFSEYTLVVCDITILYYRYFSFLFFACDRAAVLKVLEHATYAAVDDDDDDALLSLARDREDEDNIRGGRGGKRTTY